MRSLITSLLLGILLIPALIPAPLAAQSQPTLLSLRPHCEKVNQQECPDFEVQDPTTLRTSMLKVGDTLDMDVIIRNAAQSKVKRVRSWLTYDPTVLEGMEIKINDQAFAVPTPGENTFSASEGYAKIGASAAAGKEPTAALIVVARVTFTVKQVPGGGKSVIGFHDLKSTTDGHTAVIVDALGLEQNVLPPTLGTLLVHMEGGAAATTSSKAMSSAPAADRTAFVLLQVQNLRITTDGSAIFLAWDALRSADLQGYNVYYGTEMGRYIQRKSVDIATTSLALRGLPVGTTYYVAVRAVNKANEESAFSQEVAVEVGDPRTSTSPLSGNFTDGPQGQNPLDRPTKAPTVPGESGPVTNFALFFLLCAVMGTAFAFRRQLIASVHPHQRT